MVELTMGKIAMIKRAPLLLLVAGLAACTSMGPDYQRPAMELPTAWNAVPGNAASAAGEQWWRVFRDPQLDALVEEALKRNANVAIAVARLDEARAQLRSTDAERFPAVTAGFDRARQQNSVATATSFPGIRREYNDYRGALNVSYELDLWGRLARGSEAARAELLATEAAGNTVRLSLASQVAQSWFALRALDAQIEATKRVLGLREQTYALQKKRLDGGLIAELDLRQVEADVAAARAQLPGLEREREAQTGALSVLVGRTPRAVMEGGFERAVQADAAAARELVVPTGLPSELLLRRPDLVESEQKLIAANARIGAARAALFPTISLTGTLGSQSMALSDLFSGPAGLWRFVASVSQPIWQAGRLQAQEEVILARQRQAQAGYELAIQTAFREVRDALAAQVAARERAAALAERARALSQALRLAKLRYDNGVSSQLEVLDAERALLAAETDRIDALRAQRAAIADLFKALGGGWG